MHKTKNPIIITRYYGRVQIFLLSKILQFYTVRQSISQHMGDQVHNVYALNF